LDRETAKAEKASAKAAYQTICDELMGSL
jgi:hypothetical protein